MARFASRQFAKPGKNAAYCSPKPARLTQARASALVVGSAPVAFTAIVMLADPRVGGVLFGSLLGLACLVVGGLLEVACVVWMRRLVAGASER